jgi:NADPH2:quinone reductase
LLAAWYNRFGPANEVLQIGELKEPVPKAGEVKVRIFCSAVNPSDTKKRLGSNPIALDQGQIIPHSDGAGKIIDVGSDELNHRIGERVWLYEAQHNRNFGTSAEYICLPSLNAITLPKNTNYDVGAMMGIPAITAHRCVHIGKSVEDCYVLITGGAGRVGHYAIQWAKRAGAIVIATASNSKGVYDCKNAGADVVFEHPSSLFVDQVMDYTNGQKVDKIIDSDFGINLDYLLAVIKPNCEIITFASMTEIHPRIPFYKMMNMNLNLKMVFVYDIPKRAKINAINDITSSLKEDRLINRLSDQYDLEDIRSAHIKIEKNITTHGAVIINL